MFVEMLYKLLKAVEMQAGECLLLIIAGTIINSYSVLGIILDSFSCISSFGRKLRHTEIKNLPS